MDTELLERKFSKVGIPVRVLPDRSWFGIDVGRNAAREWIALSPGEADVQVIDADAVHHQVLLLVKSVDGLGRRTKEKILAGRDERSLFAVRVFGGPRRTLNTVAAAHEALMPEPLRGTGSHGRRVPRYRRPRPVRQGDWFFLPCPGLPRDMPGAVRKGRLGIVGGRFHVADLLLGDPRTIRLPTFSLLPVHRVYARGFVRHPEHRPLHLPCWHEVFPNMAGRSAGGYVD